MAEVLRRALAPLAARISEAFVYGSIARGEERAESDVDLLVIGSATAREVSRALFDTRASLGREVNASVFTLEDLAERIRQKRAFPCHPLAAPKVFVLGTAEKTWPAL